MDALTVEVSDLIAGLPDIEDQGIMGYIDKAKEYLTAGDKLAKEIGDCSSMDIAWKTFFESNGHGFGGVDCFKGHISNSKELNHHYSQICWIGDFGIDVTISYLSTDMPAPTNVVLCNEILIDGKGYHWYIELKQLTEMKRSLEIFNFCIYEIHKLKASQISTNFAIMVKWLNSAISEIYSKVGCLDTRDFRPIIFDTKDINFI